MSVTSLFRPGHNCCRTARADRAALLIDAARYFSVLRRVLRDAQRSIFIIGWEIDSRIPLGVEGEPDDGLPAALGDFLDALARRSDGLHIHVLNWDFTMLYAGDREFLPIYHLGWRTHRRVHFQLDDRHPPGASHHQKIVVVDDAIAFVGGIDLTKARWDTPEHAADDPRRCTPDGRVYPPFHDMQLMVDGEAAAAVGAVARRRWQRATGQDPVSSPGTGVAWPGDIEPDFRDVEVAIARTEPGYDGDEAVGEVKALYLDAIAAARRVVYLENQYFTAPAIAEAIARRLAEAEGPEFVIVSRCFGSGWLENNTMTVLRARRMRELKAADKHDRLRFYYPDQAGLESENCIALHSKLATVDDRLLRVGSANLNNRSMGLDTECDLAIDAGRAEDRAAITGLRNRLLAEHLGVEPDDVAGAIGRNNESVIAAIEALRGNARTLTAIPDEIDPQLDEMVPDAETIDPEHPIDPDRLIDNFVPSESRPAAGARAIGLTIVVLAVVALAAAWRWGVLGEWLNPDALREIAGAIERSPMTPLWVLGAYVLASIIMVPVTLLVVATAFVFGPWAGFAYAIAGSVAGAGVTFALGRILGRDPVRRIAGDRVNALSRKLGKGGIVAVMVIRMLPVAPFTVVNIVAGATHLRARDFLVGTALGMAPGILAITVFADALATTIFEPSPANVGILAAVILAISGVALAVHRWAIRRGTKAGAADAG